MDSEGRLTGEELKTLLEHEANLPPDEDAPPHPNSILGLQQQRAADRHHIQKLQSTVAELEAQLKNLQDKVLGAFTEGFNPKVHAPNAIQTNPGDENY